MLEVDITFLRLGGREGRQVMEQSALWSDSLQ